MKRLAASVALSFAVSSAFAQTSFDQYFKAVNRHQLKSREAAFVQSCGLDRNKVEIVYGISTESEGYKFHRTSTLGTGRGEAQTDFFGTAEIWKVHGKPRFVNAWTLVMDVGQEDNEMFCFDETGRLTAQESLNSLNGESSGGASWTYLQSATFDLAGQRRFIHGRYIRKDGSTVAPPKLSKEDSESSKSALDAGFANDVITQVSR